MTGKRFVDGGEECIEDQFFIDTSTDKNYWVSDGLDDIIKLLNELHEENQTLKSLIDEDIITLLNKEHAENQQLKQLLNTILTQIEIENIDSKDTIYSAKIIFTFEEYQKIREIWKNCRKTIC